jgi:1-deoxy-D-xylulose-5-phosphate synthase
VRYNRVKAAADQAGHRLKLTFFRGIYHRIESRIKSLFLGNAFFEQFSLRYIGPVDGHDIDALKAAFTVAKEDKRSVLVHVVTKKGKGFAPAELEPTKWHGVGGFDLATATLPKPRRDWSAAVGEALIALQQKDSRIVALTAGMKDGTGLSAFAERFASKFFDVGIAEGHLVAFAAGLAAGGMRPVAVVYSTFLQRSVDQIMHDVALSSLPVIFCVDRAGVVGADGITHQGVFDIAMLRTLPNLVICQPKDEADLLELLEEALKRNAPTVIRYPRGGVPAAVAPPKPGAAPFAIWATGDWFGKACEIAKRLGGEAVHARYIKPFDAQLLARHRAEGKLIVSMENGAVAGGFGEAIGADIKFGWPDEYIAHGTQAELEKHYGLDLETMESEIKKALEKYG